MLAHVSAINGQTAHAIASGVAQGGGAWKRPSQAAAACAPDRGPRGARGFVAALNDIFLIGAIVAIVASALTLVLIRSRDFDAGAARGPQPASRSPGPPRRRARRPRWASRTDLRRRAATARNVDTR